MTFTTTMRELNMPYQVLGGNPDPGIGSRG